VPVEVAFDYLSDPRNRPQWQSSLRRVELLDDEVALGQRWVDVTAPGLRPLMQTVELERPSLWSESGSWRGRVTAVLSLTFVPKGEGCSVHAEFSLQLPRFPERLVGPLLRRLAPYAVQSDLRRAARILSGRAAGH
jgi:hypothetical protein